MAALEKEGSAEERPEDDGWPFVPHDLSLKLHLVQPLPGQELVNVVDPFLTLSDRGAFSRVLLAEVVGPTDKPVLSLALKIQSDEYPVLGEGESAEWNNRTVEDAWRREIDLLERCGSVASGVPAPVEVLARRRGENAHLPPTLFCKRRRAFFGAPCPDCGGPLGDFRDSRALEARGLPRYDRSLTRFLGCPACAASGRRKLWTLVHGPEDDRADVGDQADLFRALDRLARTTVPSGETPVIPCQGCPHVPTCYPQDMSARAEALHFLTPVTFYESECVALELLHFHYDEFAALLGGATMDDVAVGVGEAGRRAALGQLEPLFRKRSQFLFEEGSARFGLEVLRLKLTLFRQLCGAVATLHRHSRAPHLALAPQRAMVKLLGQWTALPNLWSFAVTLLGLGNVQPRVVRGGNASDLPAIPYARPRVVDPVFSASPLRASSVAEQPCTLTVRRVTGASGERFVLEVDVECDSVNLAEIGEKDTLDINVVQGRPPLALQLAGTPAGMTADTLRVRSVPLALDADLRGRVEQAIGQPLTRARLTVYPCLHVPCDIYSLGKLLLVTLLARPRQSQVELSRAIEDVGQRLALFARENPDASAGTLTVYAGELLVAGRDQGLFARRNLFADPDRCSEAAAGIPEALWLDTLLLGMRALTTVRGFSICRNHSDFDPIHPEVQAEYLLQLTDALVRQVDGILFGAPDHGQEIREAIRRVARELSLEPGAKVG